MSRSLHNLQFGNPSAQVAFVLQQPHFLDSIVSDMAENTPAGNDSDLTINELRQLLEMQAKYDVLSVDTKTDVECHAEFLMQLVIDTFKLDQYKLDVSQIVQDVVDDLNPLILKLKFKFQRPRPHQLAVHHKIRLFPAYQNCYLTPSYPSGNVLVAYVLAEVLSSKHPETEPAMRSLARRMASCMMLIGANYGSDTSFAMMVANEVVKHEAFAEKYSL